VRLDTIKVVLCTNLCTI